MRKIEVVLEHDEEWCAECKRVVNNYYYQRHLQSVAHHHCVNKPRREKEAQEFWGVKRDKMGRKIKIPKKE